MGLGLRIRPGILVRVWVRVMVGVCSLWIRGERESAG